MEWSDVRRSSLGRILFFLVFFLPNSEVNNSRLVAEAVVPHVCLPIPYKASARLSVEDAHFSPFFVSE